MQVFLIRHPRPLVGPGICYGRLDVDCVDALPVAHTLKALLPNNLPAPLPVYSSPLRRARQLAEALTPHVMVDDRLREIDFGTWEGRRWDDIERDQIDAWADDVLGYTPPGGESVAALQRRAVEFASTLEHSHVAIVTHAGVMRALVGHWRKLPVAEWSRLSFEFGTLTHLEVDAGTVRS